MKAVKNNQKNKLKKVKYQLLMLIQIDYLKKIKHDLVQEEKDKII